MEHCGCLLCQTLITSNNNIDIQLTTTKIGQVNVEEFIKDTILGIPAHIILRSKFLCQQCFAAVNTLEDHFLMYKSIQQTLLEKYNNLDIKQELIEYGDSAKDLETFGGSQDDDSPEYTDPDFESKPSNANRIEKSEQQSTRNQLQGRKSARKRNSVPNYLDQDTNVTVQVKKIVKKTKSKQDMMHNKSTANNNFDDDDDDNELLHDNSALPEKPAYCCEICGKQYVNYNGWNIHRRKHKNENLIRCEYCNKTFTQKIGLKRHLHMHTGTFPYECDICNKKFVHTSSFKIHKQIHEGKRNHICELCGMGFFTKPCLKRHMRSHTKEKRHGCELCGAMFTEKYNLNAHIAKVHGREREVPVPEQILNSF